jgi:hypothetical protein
MICDLGFFAGGGASDSLSEELLESESAVLPFFHFRLGAGLEGDAIIVAGMGSWAGCRVCEVMSTLASSMPSVLDLSGRDIGD